MNKLWIIPLSIGFGLIVAVLIRIITCRYNADIKEKETDEPNIVYKDYPLTTILAITNGFFEIMIYSFCILINIPSFIAFWIGIKTAVSWKLEKKSDKKPSMNIEYNYVRVFYFRFLIGNALNIISSYIICCIIKGEMIYFSR